MGRDPQTIPKDELGRRLGCLAPAEPPELDQALATPSRSAEPATEPQGCFTLLKQWL